MMNLMEDIEERKEYMIVKDIGIRQEKMKYTRTLKTVVGVQGIGLTLSGYNAHWQMVDNMQWLSEDKQAFDPNRNVNITKLNVQIPMVLVIYPNKAHTDKGIEIHYTFHVTLSVYHDNVDIQLNQISENHKTFFPQNTDPFQPEYRQMVELQDELESHIKERFDDVFDVTLKYW